MAELKVKIEGLDELVRDMRDRFPKEYEGAVETAMETSVKDVEKWAKQNVPVDTGRLRSSIHSEVSVMGDVKGIVGSTVKYAPFVEQPGGVRRTGRRPWLHPAVHEHQQEILANFEKQMDKLLGKFGD